MSHQIAKGISYEDLDAAFEQEETIKSNLLLDIQFLRAQQKDVDEIAAKFAQAATIEEHLSEVCLQKGLRENFFVHRWSAASCWAGAGNFYRALELCDELLAQPDLTDRLHQRIQQYASIIRTRRARLDAEIAETEEVAMAA
jgi:hypothetical protein